MQCDCWLTTCTFLTTAVLVLKQNGCEGGNIIIRFMICDTDTVFLEKLAAALHRNFDPCAVEYLYGPSALEVSLRSDSCDADILLTEIELRGKSAISIIKNSLRDTSPLQIIYMTSKMDYCTEVYETRHCGFLMKPVNLKRLIQSVHHARHTLETVKASSIVVPQGNRIHVLSPQSLLYVESHGRVLKIVTDNDLIETYDKLSHFSFRLDKRFLLCHKSYLVNMERVARFFGDSFQMQNGAKIPISQSKRKEVRELFLAYMGNCAFSKIM